MSTLGTGRMEWMYMYKCREKIASFLSTHFFHITANLCVSMCTLPSKVLWEDLFLRQRRKPPWAHEAHLSILQGEIREAAALCTIPFPRCLFIQTRGNLALLQRKYFHLEGTRMCHQLSDWKAVSQIGISSALGSRLDNYCAKGEAAALQEYKL